VVRLMVNGQLVVYVKHKKIILCKRCKKDITSICYGPRLYCPTCALVSRSEIVTAKYHRTKKLKVKKWQKVITALKEGPKTFFELVELTKTKNLPGLLNTVKREHKISIRDLTVVRYRLIKPPKYNKKSFSFKDAKWELVLRALVAGPKTVKELMAASNCKSTSGLINYLRDKKGIKLEIYYTTTYSLGAVL